MSRTALETTRHQFALRVLVHQELLQRAKARTVAAATDARLRAAFGDRLPPELSSMIAARAPLGPIAIRPVGLLPSQVFDPQWAVRTDLSEAAEGRMRKRAQARAVIGDALDFGPRRGW